MTSCSELFTNCTDESTTAEGDEEGRVGFDDCVLINSSIVDLSENIFMEEEAFRLLYQSISTMISLLEYILVRIPTDTSWSS